MAIYGKLRGIVATNKCTSQGQGGRGRRTKIAMSTMNKSKKSSHKKYRGQGRLLCKLWEKYQKCDKE